MLILLQFNILKSFLRGWVKFLIGGKAREPLAGFGEIPRPTVTVWIGEEGPMGVRPILYACSGLCSLLLKNPDLQSGFFVYSLHLVQEEFIIKG